MKHLLNSLILMLSSTMVYAGEGPPTGQIPEPGIYALLAIGAVGMFIARKRKK